MFRYLTLLLLLAAAAVLSLPANKVEVTDIVLTDQNAGDETTQRF
jgi:hypothetical protein